jgi:hypothetical protein
MYVLNPIDQKLFEEICKYTKNNFKIGQDVPDFWYPRIELICIDKPFNLSKVRGWILVTYEKNTKKISLTVSYENDSFYFDNYFNYYMNEWVIVYGFPIFTSTYFEINNFF